MADVKISGLPAATSFDDADETPIVQGGTTKRATGAMARTYPSKSANTVFAGPASGAAAAPTFRALTAADIPIAGAGGILFDHFFNGISTSQPTGVFGFQGSTNGTGASTGGITTPDASSIGVTSLQAGTTTTGRAGFTAGSASVRLGGGTLVLTFRFQMPVLLDGTETGAIYIGFIDSGSAAPTDGAYLYWDNTQTNFRYRTRNNSVETDTDSGLAPAAATWYILRIEVNAAATSVTFTINGANSQSNATNIPTGAGRETGIGASILKSAGTTNRQVYLDYCKLEWTGVSA